MCCRSRPAPDGARIIVGPARSKTPPPPRGTPPHDRCEERSVFQEAIAFKHQDAHPSVPAAMSCPSRMESPSRGVACIDSHARDLDIS